MMNKWLKDGLCIILCILMAVAVIPAKAFAAREAADADESEKPAVLTNAEDVSTEVPDEWEEAYPYGVFAFSDFSASAAEGGEPLTVPVYRLGGTAGRVTAYVIYNPAISQLDEDRMGYANALSTDDFVLEVEDASAIAPYQPVGKDPDPEAGDLTLNVKKSGSRYTFSLSETADAYRWQAKGGSGWQDAFDQTAQVMTVDQEDYDGYDFRCVYTRGGASYCTASVHGEAYVKPDPEVLPEMPDDLDLGSSRTYTKLVPDEDDAYKAYVFPVTFADGEWVKYLRITPLDDSLAECPEAAALIIDSCEGGCINKSFNSMTITVEDNDPAEPFTLGLTESAIKADKADGSVRITVLRTGGSQEMVTLDYETVDGTAVAGKDYIADADTMAFGGNVMELSVDIQLLDDGVKTDQPKTFKLRLKNLLGDGDDLCTMKTTEVTVSLINSGTAKSMNLATKLTDADAIGLASSGDSREGVVDIDPPTVIGTQVQTERRYAEVIRNSGAAEGAKSYRFPNALNFDAFSSGPYWNYTFYPFRGNPTPASAWTLQNGASFTSYLDNADTSIVVCSSNPYGYAALPIENLTKLYSSVLLTHRMYSRGEDTHGNYIMEANAGVGTYYPGSGQNPTILASDNVSFSMSDSHNAIVVDFYMTGSGTVVHPAGHRILESTRYYRRWFSDDTNWYLTIHTANDGESGDGNVVTAPEGAAALTTATGIYDSFEPRISISEQEGGLCHKTTGSLYVGTKLRIDLVNTATYSALSTEDLSVAVYLTNAAGRIVKQAEKGSGSDYYLTLLWDGMTEADLSGSYTINVVMTRKQDVTLDVTPSVPRADDGVSIDLGKVGEAAGAFWDSGEDYVEYGWSKPINQAPYFSTDGVETVRLNRSDGFNIDTSGGTALMIPADIKDNIQWINFHRDHDDFIVMNGVAYHGDETIRLAPRDLNVRSLIFFYYAADYADVSTKMVAKIDKIGLYKDTNGNNRIDGAYDEATGFFIVDPDSGDELLMYMDDDSSYSEKMFDYIKNSDGTYSQLFYKIYYTMTPRALVAKEGAEFERAQILPALITCVTDPGNYFSLTAEQKNYRYLISGQYANGSYTSDGHLMYGPEAAKIQYVDVPLGGDKSPAESTTDSGGLVHYTWTPQYEGNLLFPYDDPDPIYIEKSVAGDSIPLAPDYERTGVLSESDIRNLNGYLGSYVADTKVSLCVFQQQHTVAEMLAGGSGSAKSGAKNDDDPDDDPDNPPDHSELDPPESSSSIEPEVMPDPASEGQGDMPDGGSDNINTTMTEGMNLDYGMKSPKFSVGYCKLSLTTNLRDFILSYRLPLGSYGRDNASKWGYSNEYKKYYDAMGVIKDGGTLKDALKKTDSTYKNMSDPPSDQAPKHRFFGFSASATLAFAAEWKYDPVQNKSIFKRFTFALVIGIQGSFTWRPAGIFYVCVTIGSSFSFGTGFYYKYADVHEDTKLFNTETAVKKGDYLIDPATGKNVLKVNYRTVDITFKGKIGIELFEDEGCTTAVKNAHKGYIQSDSMTTMQIGLSSSRGFKFKDDTTYYLRISAQDDNVTVKTIEQVTGQTKAVFCDGFDIGISPFAELSAGFGGGIIKAEVCAHAGFNLNIAFSRGGESANKIKDMDWSFSASLNAQLIMATVSYEIVGVYQSYTQSGGWGPVMWTSFGKTTPAKNSADKGASIYDAVLNLPEDTSDTQKIYTPQDAGASSGGQKAYQPTDTAVPFELSGYYTSSDAARLLDGVVSGYDYRVVTVADRDGSSHNYVIYHISRDSAASTLDQSMLVMSELVMTGDRKGLVNPVDHDAATPYIAVDVDAHGSADATGDLDFSVDTTDGGRTIRAAWISYASAAEAGTASTIQALGDAAANTVVKTASFTVGSASFTPASVISNAGDANAAGDTGECVLIPDIEGDAVAYVRSNPITDEELEARTALYEDYLRTRGYDVSNTDPSDDAAAKQSYAVSLIATQRAAWVTAGGSSDLCIGIGSAVSSVPMGDGVTVDSVKLCRIGDTYYIAYITKEECYTDTDGSVITDASRIANRLTVKRLYLRTCTFSGGRIVWGMDGKAILLRTIYDYDNNDTLTDGVYTDGAIVRKDNPYFDNLQFLNAALGDSLTGTPETFPLSKNVPTEDFLLFDMCGSTYIIRQSSLQAMTGSAITTDSSGLTTTTGTIIPFFTPDVSHTDNNGANVSTGRIHTTIGVDGDGNLAAVYISGVPGTNNTALCISKYDPGTGWGDKTVLAMNYLGVYEDNLKYFRSDEDAAKAFYGTLDADSLEEGANLGGLNEFQFMYPQFALGKETVTDGEGNITQKPTLLILTQGVMHYLKENTDEATKALTPYLQADADEVLAAPDLYERSRDVPPGVGIYAIEYGSGTQSVGSVTFDMPIKDFSVGATPAVSIGFENTGDVAIRGSADQPITVTVVSSDDASVPLAKWQITENIIPGQQVALKGTLELSRTLPVGSTVFLTVAEDDYYASMGGTPFSASSQPFVEIEEYPELSITEPKITFDAVHADGDTLVDVDFIAGNRGTTDAKGVTAVFSYDTGARDADGNAVYAPLDLTGSALTAEDVELKRGSQNDLPNGALYLGDIAVGYGKHVSGTLKVSSDLFKEKATKALGVKVELFSEGDAGLPDGVHNEYNSINNLYVGPVEHETVFTAPVNITAPAGTELRIPIDCAYTTGDETPHILVTEFPDLDGDIHFGAHAFRYGEFGDGNGSGTLELRVESEGSGYIRIQDTATNSFFDIAYTVTPQAKGVNIYNDNSVFTFYNADGTPFDEQSMGQAWEFPSDVTSWGDDSTAPYLNNLAAGMTGTSFTFRTLAESIDLVFVGEVTVSSTLDGFEPVTVSASGGDGNAPGEYASVNFGKNPDGVVHTVTVTVTDGVGFPTKYAYFDRVIEHFNAVELPVPDHDENGPQIFFSRSFPDSGLIAATAADGSPNTVTIPAYVFDETGIASVTINGRNADVAQKHDVRFWTVNLAFSGNGRYKITMIDDYGNMTEYVLYVDWFDPSAAQTELPQTPEVSATVIKKDFVSNVTELTDDVEFSDSESAYVRPAGKTPADGAPTFTVTGVTVNRKDGLLIYPTDADSDNDFLLLSSGWYIVQASDPDADGESWSATVIQMMRLTVKKVYVTADDQIQSCGQDVLELTYHVSGPIGSETFTGELACDVSSVAHSCPITQGTLTAPEGYMMFFTPGKLTIKDHVFSQPTWEWFFDKEVVELNINDDFDIHPGYYTVNGGAPIEKNSAVTVYRISGISEYDVPIEEMVSQDQYLQYVHLKLHDHETSHAVYNIEFDRTELFLGDGDYCIVNGSNAAVNMSFTKQTTLMSYGHVITNGEDVETDTPVNIAVDSGITVYLASASCSSLVGSGITLTQAGTYNITDFSGNVYADSFTDDVLQKNQFAFRNSQGIPDGFGIHVPAASANFVCTVCGSKHTEVDASPITEEVPPTCETGTVTQYTATVTYDGETFTDSHRISEADDALGHDYVAGTVVPPTCSEKGYTVYTCSRCGATVHRDETPATGDHPYGEPEWEWYSGEWDVVEIDMQSVTKLEIHPNYYAVNSGDPIKKRSAYTRYVLTGSTDQAQVILHDHERRAATYHLCFSDLHVQKASGNFCLLNGSDAVVNLSLRGDNSVVCQNGIVFAKDEGDSAPELYLAKEDGGETDLTAHTLSAFTDGIVVSSYILFNRVGDYDLDETKTETGGLFPRKETNWHISGGTENVPFVCPADTLAVFTCTHCQHEETVKADLGQEYRSDRPYLTATAAFKGRTYTDARLTAAYILGDADDSGEVSILDATVIQRYLAAFTVGAFDLDAANVTGRTVSALDATVIQRYLAGFVSTHRIGESVSRSAAELS